MANRNLKLRPLAQKGGPLSTLQLSSASCIVKLGFISGRQELQLKNKFWEELITYIPLIRHGRHRQQQQNYREPSNDKVDTQAARRSHMSHKPKTPYSPIEIYEHFLGT
jgi:hypothetical protein